MNAKEKTMILKATLLKRKCCCLDGGQNYTTKEEDMKDMSDWICNLSQEVQEKEYIEYIDSLRDDIEKTPEQRQKEREEQFEEFLESEAAWEASIWSGMRYNDRDEWDDLWADRAKSVGATPR